VEVYRRAGHAVVGTSRSISPSDEPGFLTVEGDITQVDTVQRVVDEAIGRFGRIDSLINNAGLFFGKPFDEYTPHDFADVTAVNLAGFFHLTQCAVSAILLQRNGHIVNIRTSLVVHADSHAVAALASLTKGGLVAVTRSLAIECRLEESESMPSPWASSKNAYVRSRVLRGDR
jgi:NAD(P)-dependent dehydrogenase (short-subunit alcohol dehydrogenase family)